MTNEITQLKNGIAELKNILTDMSAKINDLHRVFISKIDKPEKTKVVNQLGKEARSAIRISKLLKPYKSNR